MKILFLFPHFFLPGGAANAAIKFARALNQKGYQTEILCCGMSDEFKKENADLHFTIIPIPPSNKLSYWALLPFWQIKINKILDAYPDHILFPHVLPSNWWAWLYKLNHRDKKIVWLCQEPSAFIHSKTWIKAIVNPGMRFGATIFNPILKKIDVFLEKTNDATIANSEFTKQEFERCYRHKPTAVIYPPSVIKEFPLNTKDSNYLFTVSRLSKFKNVDMLIKAFSQIAEKFPSYKLLIAGNGEEKESLIELSKKLNIPEHQIQFLGRVSDEELIGLYSQAKATALCSMKEPFGLVPVESMMYGTPVIAHNSGGPKETILNNKTGFLFNNEDELATYLEKIITIKEEEYSEMQRACQQQAKQFDISILAQQLEDVFRNIKE